MEVELKRVNFNRLSKLISFDNDWHLVMGKDNGSLSNTCSARAGLELISSAGFYG
jgi:hypothetical protein